MSWLSDILAGRTPNKLRKLISQNPELALEIMAVLPGLNISGLLVRIFGKKLKSEAARKQFADGVALIEQALRGG